jgi:hypothetical protein
MFIFQLVRGGDRGQDKTFHYTEATGDESLSVSQSQSGSSWDRPAILGGLWWALTRQSLSTLE